MEVKKDCKSQRSECTDSRVSSGPGGTVGLMSSQHLWLPARDKASQPSSMEEEGVPKPVSTGLVKVINLNLH